MVYIFFLVDTIQSTEALYSTYIYIYMKGKIGHVYHSKWILFHPDTIFMVDGAFKCQATNKYTEVVFDIFHTVLPLHNLMVG